MDRGISSGPGVFFTDETRAALSQNTIDGLMEGIPHGKHVLVVGVDDIVNGKATPNLKEHFKAAGLKPNSRPAEFIVDTVENITGTGFALQGAGINITAIPISPDSEKTRKFSNAMHKDACIITAPMEGGFLDVDGKTYDLSTVQGFAEAGLIVKPGTLKDERLPGNKQDLQLWTAHHESDHCRNLGQKYYEYQSDTHANKQYGKDLAAGRVSDPELPYHMRSVRAGAFMLDTSGDAYRLNGLTPLAGEKPLNNAQLAIADKQIGEARDRVYNAIEKDMHISHEELMKPENEVSKAQLVYQQSRILLAKEGFNDLPYGKTMVERFVDGAERYGHNLYGVDPAHERKDQPAMPNAAYGIPESSMTFKQTMPDIRF